ncbi:hypothetical protein PMI04_006810 [Sphingobium sp. AP49]|uniref:hypothetical protein n=1 Tax=Sphingobium sp. AP49 TaxID=1144307 RepID=UPI00026ECAEC|nr:hypothetical protein [Sphingobium sp. AP49]WHO40298.1 hypothetical protein PMI04_006810 [Sphingobium sp. AP49]
MGRGVVTWPDTGNSGPQRLLALGGCTVSTISTYLQRYVFARHYWRQNIVCDMSAPLDVRDIALDDAHAVRVIDKYAGKFHRKLIEQGDFDWLLLECAADHVFQYLRIGDAVVPDLRNDLFKPEWVSLSFDDDPLLGKSEQLLASDPVYWVLWKKSFSTLYDDVLLPHIRDGKKVIFVRRYMCLQFVDEFGRHYFEDMDIPKQNDALRDVYSFLDSFEGLTFIDPPEDLLSASQYAPWGGPSVLHPEQEFYHFVVEDILRKCASAELADAFRREVMAASMEERIRYAFQASYARSLSEQQREQLMQIREHLPNGALGCTNAPLVDGEGLVAQINELQSERDISARQVMMMTAERDHLVTALQSIEAAHAAAAAQLAELERRYAPLQKLYDRLWMRRRHGVAGTGRVGRPPHWSNLPGRQIVFAIAFTQLDELFQLMTSMFPGLSIA